MRKDIFIGQNGSMKYILSKLDNFTCGLDVASGAADKLKRYNIKKRDNYKTYAL